MFGRFSRVRQRHDSRCPTNSRIHLLRAAFWQGWIARARTNAREESAAGPKDSSLSCANQAHRCGSHSWICSSAERVCSMRGGPLPAIHVLVQHLRPLDPGQPIVRMRPAPREARRSSLPQCARTTTRLLHREIVRRVGCVQSCC